MNELINRFLLAGDKFIAKMQLRQYAALNNIPAFTYSACGPITKSKEKYKNVEKQKIQDTFFKTNQIKPVFNMIWFMMILKFYLEELLLRKSYVINHSIY